ncbi:15079_t:CDS:1, partial [Acaulospora morrowiae]
SLISSNSFALSLRPLTLSVEIVIIFFKGNDGIGNKLLEKSDKDVGNKGGVLLTEL